MNELTIVTAFFDINRANFSRYPRTVEEYLNYFKFWARIKNKLIVYTYHDMAIEVKKIREDFGLLDKTVIIEIDDIKKIEPDIYERMKSISNNKSFNDIRVINNAVSNGYKYDYVMLLKYWCLYDAVKQGHAKGMVSWMDFGFNHGDLCFTNSEEFSFTWSTKLNKDKIHLFSLKEIDTTIPIFLHVIKLDDSIMGSPVILNSNKCEVLWHLVKTQMESLIRVGFIDDDQLLLLMSFYDSPELFEIHLSDWFMPLKENGGEHLSIRNKEIVKKKTILARIKGKILRMKKEREYIIRISTLINK